MQFSMLHATSIPPAWTSGPRQACIHAADVTFWPWKMHETRLCFSNLQLCSFKTGEPVPTAVPYFCSWLARVSSAVVTHLPQGLTFLFLTIPCSPQQGCKYLTSVGFSLVSDLSVRLVKCFIRTCNILFLPEMKFLPSFFPSFVPHNKRGHNLCVQTHYLDTMTLCDFKVKNLYLK